MGGESGCERRIEVFVKNGVGGGGGSGGGGIGWGGGRGRGQGGCEQRIEVFVKIQKKNFFGGRVGLGGESGWM